MTDTTPDSPPLPEGVRLLPTGGVAFVLDGIERTMRPPKIGVLRKLAEAEEELRHEVTARGLALEAAQADDIAKVEAIRMTRRLKRTKGAKRPDTIPASIWNLTAAKANDAQDKANRRIGARTREFAEWQRSAWLGWFRQAYAASVNGTTPPLPDSDDDLEPWMAHQLVARSVILNHFESIPLARGDL